MRAKVFVVGVLAGVVLSLTAVVLAGSLDPPSKPKNAASQMYTLAQVFQRLTEGEEGSKMTAFTEPASGPGTAAMHSPDEIMAIAPLADNAGGALSADVRSGTKYWGLRTDRRANSGWGIQTGKMEGFCTCSGTLVGTRWCDEVNFSRYYERPLS